MFKIIFFLLVIFFIFYIGNLFLRRYYHLISDYQKPSIISENFKDYNDLSFFFDITQKSKLNFSNLNITKNIKYQLSSLDHQFEIKINCQSTFFNQQFIKLFNQFQNNLKLKQIHLMNNKLKSFNDLTIYQEDKILFDIFKKENLNNQNSFSTQLSNLKFINALNKLYFLFVTNKLNLYNISEIKNFSRIGVLNNYDLIRLERMNKILDINFNIIKYENKIDLINDLKTNKIKFIFITLYLDDIEKLLSKNPDFFLISIDKKYHESINYINKVIFLDQQSFDYQNKNLVNIYTCYVREILLINSKNNYNNNYYYIIYLFLVLLIKNLEEINFKTQFKYKDIFNENYLCFCTSFFDYHPAAQRFWINRAKILIM